MFCTVETHDDVETSNDILNIKGGQEKAPLSEYEIVCDVNSTQVHDGKWKCRQKGTFLMLEAETKVVKLMVMLLQK